MKKIKVLNLYAGLGGNRKKWENVEVTAVELEDKIIQVYKDHNPEDNVIQEDAHDFLLKNYNDFDFIWSSPPCPTHSKMMKATRHKNKSYPDMSLYQQILLLKHFFKGKFVVENVIPYYDVLIPPTVELQRHLFWTNFKIHPFELKSPKNFINSGTVKDTEALKEWLGIHYEGNIYYKGNHCPGQVLRNCVHPDLGLHVFNCAYNNEVKTDLKIGLFDDGKY